MKPLFLTVLFALFGFHQAGAQAITPAPQAVASPAPTLRLDSVAILRQVYRHNRQYSRPNAVVAVSEIALAVNSLSYANTNTSRLGQPLGVLLIGLGSANLVLNIMRWARYSRRHEEEAVLLLQHGQALPHYAQGPYLVALTRIKTYVH